MDALGEESWREVSKAADLANSIKVSLGYVPNEVYEENEIEVIRCVSPMQPVSISLIKFILKCACPT